MTVYSPLPVRRSIRARLVVFGALLAAGAGAVIGLLLAFAAPAASAAGTCSIYFTGATNMTWETVTNWSLTNGGGSAGRIPTSTDFVCMSTSPVRSTATVAGSADVAGINFPDTATVHPTVNFNAGVFTVGSDADGSFASTVNNLKLAASTTLGGTAALTVTGSAASIGASAVLDGTGTLTLASGTITTLNSVSVQNGRHVINNGAMTVTGPAGSYWLFVVTSGVLENANAMTFSGADGILYSDATAGSLLQNDVGATMTTSLSTVGAVLHETVAVDLQGAVSATKGHLALEGGGALGGTWSLASGTSVDLAGGAFSASGLSETGAGSVNVSGGALSGTATLATAGFSAGMVSGPAAITVGNATIGATTFDGAGTLTLSASGTSTMNGAPTLSNGFRLLNNGSLAATGPAGSYWLYVLSGGVLENANAGTLTFTGPDGYLYSDGTPGNLLKNDAGATMTTSLSTVGAILHETVPVDLQGTVTATKGHLSLEGGGALGGTWSLASGTSVDLTSGTFSASGLSATGVGSVNVAGGTLSGNATLATAGFSAGMVSGPAAITVGNATIGATTFDGAGTLTLSASGTSTMNGAPTLSNGFRLLNNGSLAATGPAGSYWLYVLSGGVLENAGTLTFSGSNGFIYSDGTPTNLVINDTGGTMIATLAAAATLDVGPSLTNLGMLNVAAGTVNIQILTTLNGSGVLTGGTYQTTGGTLRIPGSIITNNAAVVVTTGSIVDSTTSTNALIALRTNTGTLTIAQSVNVSGAVTNTGTVTVNGGVFRPTSYTQSGGLTTVGSGATLKSGTTGTAGVAINGGVLAGVGTVQGAVSGGGTVRPGGGAGALAVTGSYTPAAAGTLQIGISGPSAPGTDFGRLSVSGSAAVPNNLVLNTNAGYAPPVGTIYTIVTAGTRTGTFSSVTGQDIGATGTYYDLSYTATTVVLTVKTLPQISVNDVSVTEGNSGTTNEQFTVTLDQASVSRTVTVGWATADSSAKSPSDYTAASGTVTFAPGVTSQQVSVVVKGDTLYEANETYTVNLSTPVNSSIADGTGVGTISNDDVAPAVSIGDVSQSEGNSSTSTFSFAVTIPAASGLAVSVSYATSDGTATAGSDYAAASGTATIPAGSTSTSVDVTVNGDTVLEPDQTFTVTLSAPANATVADGSGLGTIVNDDLAGPTVTGISSNVIGQGAVKRPVTITGTGFAAGATVTVSGTRVTASSVVVVNATTITASLTATATSALGARDVTVTVAATGSGTCSGCLTVRVRPVLTALSPSSLGSGAVRTVSLTGTGFVSGMKVKVSKTGAPATSVKVTVVTVTSATTATAKFTVAQAAPLGSYSVTLTNTDAGKSVLAGGLSVIAGPTVTGISPSSAARGSTTAVTITGTNFVTGATLKGPIKVTFTNVTVVNANTITATMTVSSTATTGTALAITVTNPAAAGFGAGTGAVLTIT